MKDRTLNFAEANTGRVVDRYPLPSKVARELLKYASLSVRSRSHNNHNEELKRKGESNTSIRKADQISEPLSMPGVAFEKSIEGRFTIFLVSNCKKCSMSFSNVVNRVQQHLRNP